MPMNRSPVIQVSDATRAPRAALDAGAGRDHAGWRPGSLCPAKTWSYLTISIVATLEPVPVFHPRKLAPVQSFAYSARHISAVKQRKSLNPASDSCCSELRGADQPHGYDRIRFAVTRLQHEGTAGTPTALTYTASGRVRALTRFCDKRRF